MISGGEQSNRRFLRVKLPQNHHVEGVLRPKLIEELVPMSRWMVALPLLAAGVSISDGRAASADPIAKAMAGELTPAQRQPVQAPARLPRSAHVLRHNHHLARKPKSPAHDPLSAVLAKARPTVAPPVSVSEAEGILRPHNVNTMRVPAPVSAPPATSQAAASETRLEGGRDADRDLENIVVLADNHDGTRSSPIGLRSPGAPQAGRCCAPAAAPGDDDAGGRAAPLTPASARRIANAAARL